MTLPTPKQEQAAILAFTAFSALAIIGAGALLFAIAALAVKAAQWVWGLA
jgi:hypothetical protein